MREFIEGMRQFVEVLGKAIMGGPAVPQLQPVKIRK